MNKTISLIKKQKSHMHVHTHNFGVKNTMIELKNSTESFKRSLDYVKPEQNKSANSKADHLELDNDKNNNKKNKKE